MSTRKKQKRPTRPAGSAGGSPATQPGPGLWGVSAAIVVTLVAGFYPFVVYPLVSLLTTGRVHWPPMHDAMEWMAIVAAVIVVPAALWVGFWFFVFRKPRGH
jgi:cytochrome bd-type quinol oxidase subunit 2